MQHRASMVASAASQRAPGSGLRLRRTSRSIRDRVVRRTLAVLLVLPLLVTGLPFAPVSTAIAAGSAYYVSPTGSDTGAGTQAAPFKTVQKAADTAKAGDTVYITSGTYNERVTFAGSGTAAARLTFRGYGTDRPVIQQGIAVSGDYVDVSQFALGTLSTLSNRSSGVAVSGDHNTVSDFTITSATAGTARRAAAPRRTTPSATSRSPTSPGRARALTVSRATTPSRTASSTASATTWPSATSTARTTRWKTSRSPVPEGGPTPPTPTVTGCTSTARTTPCAAAGSTD